MSLEIERQALKKEKDDLSKARVMKIDEELSTLKKEESEMRHKWEEEKGIKDKINQRRVN